MCLWVQENLGMIFIPEWKVQLPGIIFIICISGDQHKISYIFHIINMEHDFSKDVARDVLENFIERWRQQGHLDPVAKDGPPLLVNNIDFVKAV